MNSRKQILDSYWIREIDGEFIMNSLQGKCIRCDLTQFHYGFVIFFHPLNSLSLSRIHYLFREFTISFPNSLWILSLFSEFTINSLSIWQIHYGSIIVFGELTLNFTISFANSIWIHNFFRVFTLNLLSRSRLQYVVPDQLFWRTNFEFTISLANSLWIH